MRRSRRPSPEGKSGPVFRLDPERRPSSCAGVLRPARRRRSRVGRPEWRRRRLRRPALGPGRSPERKSPDASSWQSGRGGAGGDQGDVNTGRSRLYIGLPCGRGPGPCGRGPGRTAGARSPHQARHQGLPASGTRNGRRARHSCRTSGGGLQSGSHLPRRRSPRPRHGPGPEPHADPPIPDCARGWGPGRRLCRARSPRRPPGRGYRRLCLPCLPCLPRASFASPPARHSASSVASYCIGYRPRRTSGRGSGPACRQGAGQVAGHPDDPPCKPSVSGDPDEPPCKPSGSGDPAWRGGPRGRRTEHRRPTHGRPTPR